MNIPIAKTRLTEDEIQAVLEPLRSGWLVQGPKVEQFESAWSEFTGAKNSVAVTSCTTAMHLSLLALGFQPGDEAIVPAFTWVSTANVVEHLGGKVVFCDIDLDTFNIDTTQIESRITEKTKAILPVHLFGLPFNLESISLIAKKFGLWIIEDAACGFGAKFKKNHVGLMGDTGCFSFHPRKSITTGEGGMITLNDHQLADKLRRLRNHGATITDHQRHLGPRPYYLADHSEAGFNQRMTDFQAALGLTQMKRADEILSERKLLANNYDQAFKNLEWLNTPTYETPYEHGYQSYPCLFCPERLTLKTAPEVNCMRNSFMDYLQINGISTRPATHAVHLLSFYKEKYQCKPEDFPNAYIADQCSISLPLYNGMDEQEQEFVISKILKYIP